MDPYPKAYLYRRIVEAKLFIDAHYAEPIKVDDICGEAAFSKFHFIRTFKSAYGFTPHAYLSWVRIARAKELLEQGVPVSEACYAVGFESITSFSRLFKKHASASPSIYRRERLELAHNIAERPLDHVPTCYAANMGLI